MRSVADRTTNGSGASLNTLSAADRRQVLREASALVERKIFADRAGLAFDSSATAAAGWDRDYYFTLGYHRELKVDHYRAEYRRGGIASRIVEAYPRATWGGGADLQEDPEPAVVTPFETAALELFERLDVWARLLRADILAGIGRYSAILIGAPGEPNEELPRLQGPEQVLYLTPLPEDRAKVREWVEDPQDPRFGLPLSYTLNLGKTTSKAEALTRPVHWSRIIHVAEGTLEDDVHGRPRLEAVWNYLQDLLKIIGGGSEAMWRTAAPRWQLDLDPELELGEDEESNLKDETDEFIHGFKSFFRSRGVKVNPLIASTSAFKTNAEAVIQLISATTGIPYRILTGSERGELASTQDRNNWNDRIGERRREFARPVVGQLLERLIEHGALPEPETWKLVWPDSDELTEDEKAAVAKEYAEANKAQMEATGLPLLTSDEIRDGVLKKGPLEEQDLPEDEDEEREQEVLRASAFDLTDEPPDEPEWRSIHRAADAHLDAFAAAVARVWNEGAEQFDTEGLARALQHGETEGEVAALRALQTIGDRLEVELRGRIQKVLNAGAEAALRSARSRGSWFRAAASGDDFRGARFEASFDETNPRALAWAEEHSSELITQVHPETVSAVRGLIAEGFREGIPPRKLAQRIRESVGLRTDQVRAASNLRADLMGADAGDVVERFPPRAGVRGQAGFRARVPAGGATEEWADRQIARYTRMQRNLRARTIARSECLPPETPIDGAVVGAVFRRPYQGAMVEVRTAGGREFRATPNHPVLTDRGWVGAGDLKESDRLVCDRFDQHLGARRDQNIEAPPPTIAEVFDAALAIGVLERRRTGKPDFHGDGMEGEVDVALPLRPLLVGSFSPIYKPTVERFLSMADFSAAATCSDCGRLLPVDQGRCLCLSTECDAALLKAVPYHSVANANFLSDRERRLAALVSGDNLGNREVVEKVGRAAAPREEVPSCLGEIPGFADDLPDRRGVAAEPFRHEVSAQAAAVASADAVMVKAVPKPGGLGGGAQTVPGGSNPTPDAGGVGSNPPGHGRSTEAGEIELDRVLSVTVTEWSGHVFNLSTPYGYFTANQGQYTGNTLFSANRGQRELWFQAQEKGQLPEDQHRVLIATPDDRVRDAHWDANKQVVRVDEPFDLGDGTTEPGQAPNCRCAQGLATPEDLERAGLA